jgi:uncharacterized protein (DUF885 family)
MSELLTQALENVDKDVVSGVTDAEAELARLRAQCAQLQTLIGIGKATISAAKQTSPVRHRQAETPATSNAQLEAQAVITQLRRHLS